MEEESAKRLLDTFATLTFHGNKRTLDKLISEISEYTTELLSISPSNVEQIHEILYGKIIEALFIALEQNAMLLEDKMFLFQIEKLMILKKSNFFIIYEFLLAIFNFFKQTKNDKLRKFIIGIVEKVIKSDSLCCSLIFVCKKKQYKNAIEASEYEQTLKNYIQFLISIPMRIANQLKNQTPETFSLSNFSNIISYQLICSILSYNERKMELDLQKVSFILSKIVMNLGCENFHELMKIFICWSIEWKQDSSMSNFAYEMLENIDKNIIEPIAYLLLKNVENSQDIKIVFGDLLRNDHWKFVLTTKIPLHSLYKDDKVIINLITYLSSTNFSKEILLEMITKVFEVWGNKSALNHTSLAHHEYITKILLFSIKTIKERGLTNCEKNSFRQLLIAGTRVHLNNLQLELRAIGMITSELITCFFDESDSLKLKYDYSTMPHNGTYVVNKLKEFWDEINEITNLNCTKANNQISSDQLINNLKMRVQISLVVNKAEDIVNNSHKNPNKYNDENQVFQIEQEINEKVIDSTKEKEQVENVDENDLDSDDDLIPYDMSNDKKYDLTNSPPIIYLRDLKENFINANTESNAETFAMSLELCESIITSQLSNDDESFALELLMILSQLKEITYVNNFSYLKLRSCIAITKIFPQVSAKFLCNEFHANTGTYSVKDRLFFLNILTLSIKELSELDIVKSEEVMSNTSTRDVNYRNLTKPISLLFNIEVGRKSETLYDNDFEIFSSSEGDNLINNNDLSIERINSNTKIFAHSSKSLPSTANNLNKVLPFFFYPLFYGIYQNDNKGLFDTCKDFQDHDNILLINFLKALSTIMIAAKNCIIAPNIGKYLLELAWNLRYHEQAQVRCCVIENVAAVIITVPKESYTHELLDLLIEFKLWLDILSEDSVKGDPNLECKSKGKSLVNLMNCILAPILTNLV